MNDQASNVADHYALAGLMARIRDAIAKAGLDPDNLHSSDLAAMDQLHTRGVAATKEQAATLEIGAGARVLDMGCGIGGPARWLAENFDCRVTGIDLTEDYIDTARALTTACGLSDRVGFDHGSALDMPYNDSAFDIVWAQNMSMNIADKAALLAEAWRVMAPGGQLSLIEVATGTGGEPHFPLVWARTPDISFLATPDEMRALVDDAGFDIVEFSDLSARDAAFRNSAAGRARHGSPNGLDARLAFGDDFPTRIKNSDRNLAEGRTSNIRVLARKPG